MACEPDWNACVDMELLSIKHRNITADLVQEYYSYRDRGYKEYLQLFTDGSKDPLTEAKSSGDSPNCPVKRSSVSIRVGGKCRSK